MRIIIHTNDFIFDYKPYKPFLCAAFKVPLFGSGTFDQILPKCFYS